MKNYESKSYLISQLKIKTPAEIAEENNISRKTIYRMKHKFGLTKIENSWSKSEISLLINNYSRNLNLYDLFSHRTISSINHKANKLGLKRTQRTGKYNLNDEFFDVWSKESAYVFGFLWSDGNVSKNKNCISFHLSKFDISILKIIKKVMMANNRIDVRDDSVYLRIYNRRIRERVIELGCKPKKSLTLEFPSVPSEFLNHFVRGYFDGDGSIFFNRPNTIKIKIIGTQQFLSTLQDKLHEILNLQNHSIKKYNGIFFYEYYGNDARNFCFWLYKDCRDLCLKRKYYRYVEHLRIRRLNGN